MEGSRRRGNGGPAGGGAARAGMFKPKLELRPRFHNPMYGARVCTAIFRAQGVLLIFRSIAGMKARTCVIQQHASHSLPFFLSGIISPWVLS
jgi:hypothetical protein